MRRKIEDVFGNTVSSRDKQALATLIYYPREKMERIRKSEENLEDWYKITLYRLIEVCKRAASKYTRSKVRKALPAGVCLRDRRTDHREGGADRTRNLTIIPLSAPSSDLGRAEECIAAFAEVIQRLTVDHLHILGDIYDRGPGPHIIMDKLMELSQRGHPVGES